MKFFYLANIRLPTEKAHGLQIMQMCEAFANTDADLTLIVPRRVNTPEMDRIHDIWAYYGVSRNFMVRYLPCLDLFRLLRNSEKIAFGIQTLTYLLALIGILLFSHADVYYSRDGLTLLLLSLFKPRRALIYEAHQLSKSRIGRFVQSQCVRRVGLVVAVTGKLGSDLRARGAQRVLVAHDGIRLERFADLPDQATARVCINLPAEAFIVGYVGQLHTMSMSKGLDTLIEAIAKIADIPIVLGLVGGPAAMAETLRQYWIALGLPTERLLFLGRVEPSAVPLYLSAFDVCAMPFPWTEHFAYYASPLKLFEYMAAGRAIVSSDLLAVSEVVRDGETALLYPPSDVSALALALRRLHDAPALRERLGAAAQREATHYSWLARAERILEAIEP